MNDTHISSDEVARRRRLGNARMRRYRERQRRMRAEQLAVLAQSERLTDEMKENIKKQIEQEKAQRRQQLARERSRRYRDRRRCEVQDSQVPGPPGADPLFLSQSPIKAEIGSANEEDITSQGLDNAQSEVALGTVKVEYEIDFEDHFSQYIAKKQRLSEEPRFSEEDECKISSELSPYEAPPQGALTGDNYDVFGAYIATLLRALPAEKALAVQPQIVNLIVSASNEDHHKT